MQTKNGEAKTNIVNQDIFLKIEGVQGESKDQHHPNEIEIISWNWEISQDSSMHIGSGGGVGKATVHDLEFEHYVDRASPTLRIRALSGRHIKQAILTMRKAGGTPLEYSTITMTDVLITGIRTVCSQCDSNAVERVRLSFAKFREEYHIQRADGGSEGTVSGGFDIKGNAEL